jgi:hypothetical protein
MLRRCASRSDGEIELQAAKVLPDPQKGLPWPRERFLEAFPGGEEVAEGSFPLGIEAGDGNQ